ncbi:MAG: hypothetical protein AAF928_11770 [Myxococcota bacterium]
MGTFEPEGAVTFDMAFGHVHLDGAPHRVLVPAATLLTLVTRGGGDEELAELGHALGEPMGRRVGTRLAEGIEAAADGSAAERRRRAVREASFADVAGELAAEFALAGLGALSAERWGRAVVWVLDQSPFGDDGDPLVAEVLQAATTALADAPARVVALGREGVRARFLVVSGASVERVRARLAEGKHWAHVVAELHADAGADASGAAS